MSWTKTSTFNRILFSHNNRLKYFLRNGEVENYGWDAKSSQEQFMEGDNCIIVDEGDNILGQCSKKEAHIFNKGRSGVLHRAFSVFLFNSKGHLLLQQRAQHKITFPGVWTNTCCSHPLVDCLPSEEDAQDTVLNGSVPGIRNAVIRKLNQELGIPPEQYVYENLKLVTRLHYCASDNQSSKLASMNETIGGINSDDDNDWCWGEHELDYILLLKMFDKDVYVSPNPDEVKAVRYVSKEQLKDMLADEQQYKWSPWFRIIAREFLLPHWWENLNQTLVLPFDKTIHRF